jgi:biopolymer transport protein ExbB
MEPAKPAAALHELTPAFHELSAWSMLLSADAVVKVVMICLAFASLVTWTILLAKLVRFRIARERLERSLLRISKCRTLPEAELALGPKTDVLGGFLSEAAEEMRISGHASSARGIKERAASRFSEIVRMETRAVRQGMAVLATIGATAPFIGLFGTVWGIMNSFIGISKSQTTNLAVVAPGIAEALLATAFGLGAAIPAVMIYNYLSRTMRGYLDLVGRASGATGRLLSRTLEHAEGYTDIRAAE